MAEVYPMKKGPPQRYGPETGELYREEFYLRIANVQQHLFKDGLQHMVNLIGHRFW